MSTFSVMTNSRGIKSKLNFWLSYLMLTVNIRQLLVSIKRKTPDVAAILSKNKIDADNSDSNNPEVLYQEV